MGDDGIGDISIIQIVNKIDNSSVDVGSKIRLRRDGRKRDKLRKRFRRMEKSGVRLRAREG